MSALYMYGIGVPETAAPETAAPDTVRPVGDYVYILPAELPLMTESGLFIARKDRKPPQVSGTVVAVGPGIYTRKGVFVTPDVKVGDRVLFSQFAGMDKVVTLGGKLLRVMREVQIQAILDPEINGVEMNELLA